MKKKENKIIFVIILIIGMSLNSIGNNSFILNVQAATGSEVVSYAEQFIGLPYVYGGTSLTTGADCSGYICAVYEHFGVNLWSVRTSLRDLSNAGLGNKVGTNIGSAQPGDIITLDNGGSKHVVLYCGNNYVISAEAAPTNCVRKVPTTWWTNYGWSIIDISRVKLNSSVNLSVGTGDVVDITETNAVVRGMVYNTSQVKSGMKCGVRIGTASGNYNLKTYLEDVSQAAYNSGSEFPIWFNCNGELGITLKKATTYYYQMILTYAGKTYYGAEKTFKTAGTDTTKPTVTKAEITGNTNGQFIVKGTATDNDAVASFIFDVQSSNTTVKTKTVSASGGQASATFKSSELSSVYKNGKVLTVNVYAVDKAGNKSDRKSINITLKYDTQNPVVTVLSAASSEVEKITVKAVSSDDTSVAKMIIKIWGPGQSEISGAKEIECAASSYNGTFTISDIGNRNAGTYTVKAVAIDGYGKQSAAKTATVNITLKDATASSDKNNANSNNFVPDDHTPTLISDTYAEQNDGLVLEKQAQTKATKLVSSHKSMKVTLKKVKSATGYQIQYSMDKNFKKAVITKIINKNSNTKANIKKLKSGKKYYVRVRTYKIIKQNGNSIKTYSKWSKVKSVKVK